MNNDAESVISALESYLKSNIGDFQSVSRRLRYWTDVAEQPALFIRHNRTHVEWRQNSLSITTLSLELWIYCQHGAGDVPSTVINALILDLANAFAPDTPGTNRFTISGACFWCRIEGEIEFYPGDTGEQDIAIIPVTIILP